MELIQYVRDNHGVPVGVVVAVGRRQVGWSLKHKSDKWDRQKALMIARGRAVVGTGISVDMPHAVEPILNDMIDRSVRYFR